MIASEVTTYLFLRPARVHVAGAFQRHSHPVRGPPVLVAQSILVSDEDLPDFPVVGVAHLKVFDRIRQRYVRLFFPESSWQMHWLLRVPNGHH